MTYEEALEQPYDLGNGMHRPLRDVLAVLENVRYQGAGVWIAKCPCCFADELQFAVPDVVDRIM